ncbi:MAG: ribonuclease HII, partial [Bacillota bacterium]|nr:ribonuclease HII [Bacillota bacterium]
NILNATKLAMTRAIEALEVTPELILIDALKLENILIEQRGIIKGDTKSASIAAASIVAKVYRDALMTEDDGKHPEYGFAAHKGYGTKRHMDAIRTHGILEEHRRSFLKKFLAENRKRDL